MSRGAFIRDIGVDTNLGFWVVLVINKDSVIPVVVIYVGICPIHFTTTQLLMFIQGGGGDRV